MTKQTSLPTLYLICFCLFFTAAASGQTAQDYLDRGIHAYDLGDYDGAIAGFTKAIELLPSDPLLYYDRGVAYGQKGNYDLAILDYNKTIELNPDYTDAYNNRGLAYYAKGNYMLAIRSYHTAIQLNPNNPSVYNNRGLAIQNNGGGDEFAIYDFNKAIELKPDFTEAYNNRGIAYHHQGKYDQAIADYNRAIQLNPNYTNAYNNRGIAYQNKDKLVLAFADYNKAIQLDPNSTDAYFNRAWANLCLNSGGGDAAYQDASRYLELNGLKGAYAPFAVLIGYLGLRETDKNPVAKTFLETWMKQSDPAAWTTQIMHYLHGELTEAQLLALAVDNNDKLTHAHAYIGINQALAGDPKRARHHLQWVEAKGNKTFIEYRLILTQLSRLAPKSVGPLYKNVRISSSGLAWTFALSVSTSDGLTLVKGE